MPERCQVCELDRELRAKGLEEAADERMNYMVAARVVRRGLEFMERYLDFDMDENDPFLQDMETLVKAWPILQAIGETVAKLALEQHDAAPQLQLPEV
jgi:hypothetical protein